MTSFYRRERAALCDLLDLVGPDQPTLCEGWATYDMAAHLWVRESDPLAGPGIMISAFNDTTEKRMAHAKERWSYPELVDKVRNGPPTMSIFSLPFLGDAMNTIEYFVHHEDVRRGGDDITPRPLDQRDQEELWKRFRVAGRGLLRRAPTGVIFRLPDGAETTMKGGEPVVTVTGVPSELVLFGYGRRRAADVELSGDEAAVTRLRTS